jgi:hypothetical protein
MNQKTFVTALAILMSATIAACSIFESKRNDNPDLIR